MPEGWTRKQIGIERRFECVPPETLGSMAAEAIRMAMNESDVHWPDIDLILDCSTSMHRPIPCNAAHLQAKFLPDAAGIPAFDIQSTCLGFLAGMITANALMASGNYTNILIVCSEKNIAAANWNEPESAALLGDAAAAVVLQNAPKMMRKMYYEHQTWADGLNACHVAAGMNERPAYTYTPDHDADYRFHMDGRAALRATLQHLPPMLERVISEWSRETGESREILQVIPHQASVRANTMIGHRLGFSPGRFHSRLEHQGNLAAAGVPMVLHQLRNERLLNAGDPLLLLGTSAGYSQAAVIFHL